MECAKSSFIPVPPPTIPPKSPEPPTVSHTGSFAWATDSHPGGRVRAAPVMHPGDSEPAKDAEDGGGGAEPPGP